MYTRVLSLSCGLLLSLSVLNAQTPQADRPLGPAILAIDPIGEGKSPEPVLRTTRREVLVDLVVRDKHHRLITNLRPDEVEVFEDGVRQKVNAFRKVEGGELLAAEQQSDSPIPTLDANGTKTTAPGSGVESLRQLNFVGVVFADIAPLNLSFAREAVLEFLGSGNFPNTYISLYRLNHTLNVLQYYTRNKDLIAKAVNSSVMGSRSDSSLPIHAEVTSAAYSTLQAAADNLLNSPRLDEATAQAVRSAILSPIPIISKDPLFARDSASQDASIALGNAILTQARIETGIRFAASISNGMNTLDALREIVRSQEALPGRKVVLYLSDGLELPMSRQDAIASLISYANRAGVSFYAVDTRGLSLEDPMMRSLAELERTQAISSAQRSDPRTGHKEDDNIQLTAVANRQLALRELAESTGGFVVTDTNEIAAPMKRVMEEIRSHYEIAYTPTATAFDGRFRKIDVRVRRSKVEVRTRKGYFAIPELNGNPLQAFEAAALSAIQNPVASDAFPYQIAILKFRPRQNTVEHQVAFEVPLSSLKKAEDRATGKVTVRTSVLALIRNSDGEVVGKISRQLVRELSSGNAAVQNRDTILYAEPLRLPGGHYKVEAAVRDEESGRTSVKRLALFVDSGKDFGLSSLELVRPEGAGQPHSAGTADNPDLPVDPAAMLPVLDSSLSSGKPVNLYFVVYPGTQQQEPTVVLQVLQNGKEVMHKKLVLRDAAVEGQVPVMLKLIPAPGHCDILVTAQQDKLVAQSALSLNVQ